jgi:NUMOD4 motif/HNH endonuclease
MDREQFRDIKGYEGMYQVSNFGRVKSLRRTYTNSRGQVREIPEKILKQKKNRCGYMVCSLSNMGDLREFTIHKLVATAFIFKEDGKVEVNHKDGNKTNNNTSNLEWVTKSENTLHAIKHNLSGFRDHIFENLRKINAEITYKKVYFSKGNEFIVFDSISSASNMLGLKRDNITRAIRKKQKVGGWNVYGVKYANEEVLSKETVDNLVGRVTNE